MRYLIIVIFILVLLFLQIGIFPHIAVVGSFPNLIVLAVLTLSILQGWKKTLAWIIAGGLFLDFYSLHNILGISVIGLFMASYLAYFLSRSIFKKTSTFSLLLIFLITIFIYNLTLIILFKIFAVSFDLRFTGFIIRIIYNLIFALPIFYGLSKIQSKKKI